MARVLVRNRGGVSNPDALYMVETSPMTNPVTLAELVEFMERRCVGVDKSADEARWKLIRQARAVEPKAPDFRALLEEAWKAADGNEGDHVLGSDLNERIKSALNLLAEPKGCQLQNARVCAEWPACVCGRTLGSVVNRT
jgi:hypothetical protein